MYLFEVPHLYVCVASQFQLSSTTRTASLLFPGIPANDDHRIFSWEVERHILHGHEAASGKTFCRDQ